MKSLKNVLGLSALLASGALIGCMTSDNSADGMQGAAFRTQGAAADSAGGKMEKVTICHLPPGNPANAHTLSVGAPAVRAHLDHGDYLGACIEAPPDSGSSDDGTIDTSSNEGGSSEDGTSDGGEPVGGTT